MERAPRLGNLAAALVLSCALLLSANTASSAHPITRDLPTLTLSYDVGLTAWNNTLDPATASFLPDASVIELMHAEMLKALPNGRIVGDLTSHWKVSKNRRVYTFYLRTGIRFSNGDPITAEDVVWSINRAAAPEVVPGVAGGADNAILGMEEYTHGKAKSIRGLRVLNRSTVQVTLTTPAPYFLAEFTTDANDVLDPRIERGHPVGSYMTNTCAAQVGAGPFTVVCQNGGSDVTSYYPAGSTPSLSFVPNRYYHGAKPRIRISVPVISSPVAAYQSYRAGDLDVAVPSPLSEVPQWQGTKDLHHWQTTLVNWLQPNTGAAPFNNRHCRLAVAYAWDRNTVATKIYHGLVYKPHYSMVPPQVLGAYAGKDSPHFNVQKAKAELGQCPGGIHIRMPWQGTTVEASNYERAFQAMMAAAGIDITPYDVTFPEYVTLRTHNMSETGIQLISANNILGIPADPRDAVSVLGEGNIANWRNATFLRLLQRADHESKRQVRAELYVKAQQIAIHEGAFIPGFNGMSVVLLHPYVHGLVFMPFQGNFAARPVNGDWSKVSIARH